MMLDMNELFLSGILTYGIWALGLTTLVSAIGLPLPATMFLLAAGALAQQRTMDWQTAVLLAALGAILGDTISYGLARFGSELTRRKLESADTWAKSRRVFDRWGGWAVFFTRFLLTPLAVPINLLAGSTRYTPWRFVTMVVMGETLWAAAFVGMGYLFADRWEAVSEIAGSLTNSAAIGAVAIAGAAYLLFRNSASSALHLK